MPFRQFPYLSNTAADNRLLGFPAIWSPYAQFTSGSRGDMLSSHVNQILPVTGAEFPYTFSGNEKALADYDFNTSRRDQDALILDRIEKYAPQTGDHRINGIPSTTVIYVGLDDNLIHYFTYDTYFRGSDGFGYETVIKDTHLLKPGNVLYKEDVITHSPMVKGARYCQGINLNVAYMTLMHSIEDAFMISKSAARKLTSTGIYRRSITVREDMHPLNLYGDALDFRFFPDISNFIREDGLICAFRHVSKTTYPADCDPTSLRTFQSLHDIPVYGEPGAEIIDVDAYTTRRKIANSPIIYGQVDKYLAGTEVYWKRVIDVYKAHKDKYGLSPEFNTLVTTAILRLTALGVKVNLPGLVSKPKLALAGRNNQTIDFMQLDITYKVRRPLSIGFKGTGRHGNKGVICQIVDDEDMPTDQNGFRADIVFDPSSPIRRMNTGQLYESAINRVSEFVRRRVHAEFQSDPQRAAATLLDYYNDINPHYADLVRRTRPTEVAMRQHVADVISNGIFLHIPPFLKQLCFDLEGYDAAIKDLDVNDPEYETKLAKANAEAMRALQFIRNLKIKWGVEISPVTYTIRDPNTNTPYTFTTEVPVCIGSQYFFLLCKLPEAASAGVGHVSHMGMPIKPEASAKHAHPIPASPGRQGEDETRTRLMDVPAYKDVRMMCLQANSLTGVEKACEALLLAPQPTAINYIDISTEELVATNGIMAVFHHLMATMGVESRRTLTTEGPPTGILGDDEPDDTAEPEEEGDLLHYAMPAPTDDEPSEEEASNDITPGTAED